jgi:SAM-dependent methyltransferase
LRQADAASLPFPDGTFDAVVAVLVHTDLDDVGAAYREAARVLRPGGRFVHVGTHPCFCAPGVERRDGSPHRLHAGYRARGWREDGPGFGAGIRPRVGVNHVPLAGLLQAVLEAGIAVDAVVEPGDEDYPTLLAVAGWQRLARMRD